MRLFEVATLALALGLPSGSSAGAGPRDRRIEHAPAERTGPELLDCSPAPGPVRELKAVKSADAVVVSWASSPDAASYNLWAVRSGDPALIASAHEIGAAADPDIDSVCYATTALDCRDGMAVASPGALHFYQTRGACAGGREGPDPCDSAAHVWIAASRNAVPDRSALPGSCAVPDLLPIRLEALVLDASGLPVPGCGVLIRPTWHPSGCSVPFGGLCAAMLVVTDAGGVARQTFDMATDELASCNCLPVHEGCPLCGGACSDLCEFTLNAYFCGTAYEALAGSIRSEPVLLEYGS